MKDEKLNIALIGFLGLCLSACVESDDMPGTSNILEPDSNKYISFASPQLSFESEENGFTRAELVDEITEFTVYGYCIPQNLTGDANKQQAKYPWQGKAAYFTKGPDVLNGHVVKVDGVNTYYSYSNAAGAESLDKSEPREWYNGPEHLEADDYNYAFIATSTPRGSFVMSNKSNIDDGYPVLTFELPWSSNNLNTVLDYSQQPDALIGTKFDQYNNSKVKLAFKHIMTGLRFRFHNECSATVDDDKDLHIYKVTFSGKFYKKANFIFDSETMRSEIVQNTVGQTKEPVTYSGTFVLLNNNDNPQNIAAGQADFMRRNGDPKEKTVKLLLLPNVNATLDPSTQKVDDWALGTEKQITIEYSIGKGNRKTWSTDKGFQLKYIPDVNSLHTANFHFVGDDFIITFQGENEWENGSDSMLEIH